MTNVLKSWTSLCLHFLQRKRFCSWQHSLCMVNSIFIDLRLFLVASFTQMLQYSTRTLCIVSAKLLIDWTYTLFLMSTFFLKNVKILYLLFVTRTLDAKTPALVHARIFKRKCRFFSLWPCLFLPRTFINTLWRALGEENIYRNIFEPRVLVYFLYIQRTYYFNPPNKPFHFSSLINYSSFFCQ